MELEEFKKNIKRRYRNGEDNIGNDFVSPCLKHTKLYRRGTGFFSSSALITYAESIDRLINEDIKIEIICSPVIQDKTLVKTLEENQTPEQRKNTIRKLGTKIILDAVGYQIDNTRRDYRNHLLAYLIAKEILKIKIAIPKDFRNEDISKTDDLTSSLYHVKSGYFVLSNNEVVAFDGSFNESNSGHTYNIENTQVLKSWDEYDKQRLNDIVSDIDNDWNGNNPFIQTLDIEEKALEIIKDIAPNSKPVRSSFTKQKEPVEIQKSNFNELRNYQIDALKKWQEEKFIGLIKMATGTGKTKLAINAIKSIQSKVEGCLVIVTAPFRPLAYQWINELHNSNVKTIKVFENNENWKSEVQNIAAFHRDYEKGGQKLPVLVCVNDTFCGNRFQEILNYIDRSKTAKMIVVDECHHFNKSNSIKFLPNNFQFRMGLSATPYESDEKNYLEKYFGNIVYEYSVSKAIEEGWLCKYNYHPILIELTDKEAASYINIVKSIDKNENDIADLNEVDTLLDGLVNKLAALKNILQKEGIQKKTLFYCGLGSVDLPSGERVKQIHSTSRMLSDLGWKVSKITSEEKYKEREQILDLFKSDLIDGIASMKILDEGIDVPACEAAYILASQRRERQAIQRRGRILRKSPEKKIANLYDFIIVGPKLTDKELLKLYLRELNRAKLFASDADNKADCMKLLNIF
jgi:superfamily II DNA or RNA helicase